MGTDHVDKWGHDKWGQTTLINGDMINGDRPRLDKGRTTALQFIQKTWYVPVFSKIHSLDPPKDGQVVPRCDNCTNISGVE